MDIYEIRQMAKLKNMSNNGVSKEWFYNILEISQITDVDKFSKLETFLKETKFLPKLIEITDDKYIFEKIDTSTFTQMESESLFFDLFVYLHNQINLEFSEYFPEYKLAFDYHRDSFVFNGINLIQIDLEEVTIQKNANYIFNYEGIK